MPHALASVRSGHAVAFLRVVMHPHKPTGVWAGKVHARLPRCLFATGTLLLLVLGALQISSGNVQHDAWSLCL